MKWSFPESWQSSGVILLAALGFAAVVGVVDYILPYEITMGMFYLGTIFFAAWFADRRMALLVALFCTVVWASANWHSWPFSPRSFIWGGFNRLIIYQVLAVTASAMRAQRATMQARLADHEHTRQLEEEILRVAEREQMRLGQDLHDGLCQHLAAIDCAVACLRHDLEERDLPEADSARFIQEQLTQALSEARDMARGIFPVQIEEEGFLAALEELARNTNRLRQLSVSIDVRGEIRIKDPQTGMHLYRIAQEALNNVSKHARARHVSITLRRTDGHLQMTIQDDGIGFSPEKVSGEGIGMQTMRYRAKSMDGELKISPGAEGGSVIRCIVPLSLESAELEEEPVLI